MFKFAFRVVHEHRMATTQLGMVHATFELEHQPNQHAWFCSVTLLLLFEFAPQESGQDHHRPHTHAASIWVPPFTHVFPIDLFLFVFGAF